MQLTVSVSGIGSIDSDLKAFLQSVNTKVTAAVKSLEAPLKEDLARHVIQDVYDKYKPKEYPRRSDHPEYGTPLSDMGDANTNFGLLPTANGFFFSYTPQGYHSGTTADLDPYSENYDADNPRPIKPNPVHGDDLIRRIETGRGYDWNVYVGKRPFWTKFVDEEMDGRLIQLFAEAMRTQGIDDFTYTWDDITRDSDDGDY